MTTYAVWNNSKGDSYTLLEASHEQPESADQLLALFDALDWETASQRALQIQSKYLERRRRLRESALKIRRAVHHGANCTVEMTPDEALDIARQFAEENELPFGPPNRVTAECCQDRPAWTVESIIDRLGGGRGWFTIDKQTGQVLDHRVYYE